MQCLLVLLPPTAETCQLGYAEKPEEELREPSRQHWTEAAAAAAAVVATQRRLWWQRQHIAWQSYSRGPSAALSTVLLCSAIAECVSVCKKWTNSSWLSLPLLQPPTPSDGYSHGLISILDTCLPVKVEFTAILSNAKNDKQGQGGCENLLKC